MKILKSWLQDHIVETLPSDEKIAEALTLKSSEVEGLEKVQVGGVDDAVFDVKTLPDRAHYMLSHRGVAYDLSVALGLTLKPEKMEVPKEDGVVSVKIESDLCSRYIAVPVSSIANAASPSWLRERLESIGTRSINTIVDATNYAMFDTGQPLHVFDADKVVGGLVIRLAKDGETIDTLSGQTIKLKSHQLIIADAVGSLALAGVKGGKRAEVTLETKKIILEVANFNPTSVRKTSFEVGIRNDSSKRFENEITSYLATRGVSVFLDVLEKAVPDCQVGLMTDVHSKLPEAWTVSVSHAQIESVLNYKISEKRVVEILEKFQCKVAVKEGAGGGTDRVYSVTPPFERLDLIIPEDIIDEVGRIEGLDKIVSILPKVKASHEFYQEFLLTEKIKDFFATKGFSEIISRSFASKGDIEVAYPMASDKGFLRTSLMPSLSESFKLAEKNAPLLGLEKIQLFEIGKTFPKTGEQLDLCFGICYTKKIKNKEQVIKAELDAIALELETALGVKLNVEFGYVKNLEKIQTKLFFESIAVKEGSRAQFVPFSRYPFIVRDIALFVPSNIAVDEVREVISASVIQKSDVVAPVVNIKSFDEFEKDGRKSIAFRLIFQSDTTTLTDDEVKLVMEERVYTAVKAKSWEVR